MVLFFYETKIQLLLTSSSQFFGILKKRSSINHAFAYAFPQQYVQRGLSFLVQHKQTITIMPKPEKT